MKYSFTYKIFIQDMKNFKSFKKFQKQINLIGQGTTLIKTLKNSNKKFLI